MSKRRAKPPIEGTIVYYVKFFNNVYKVGITKDISKRFKNKYPCEILQLYYFGDDAKAYAFEQDILAKTSDLAYLGDPFIRNDGKNTMNGETECRIADISEHIEELLDEKYRKYTS